MTAPLFILSFRHRNELTRVSEAAGWQPMAARRVDQAEARFLASGAAVAVVDARGALAEGIGGVRAIGDAVEANAAALLVLLSRSDDSALDEMHTLGATHFLVSPFAENQYGQALAFALRHAERLGSPSIGRNGGANRESWRWRRGSRTVELSPALAQGLGTGGRRELALTDLIRKLDPEGRRAAFDAVRRAIMTGEATAFAHASVDGQPERMAHHLRVDGAGEVVGRAETLGGSSRTGSRDALTGLPDGPSARAWLADQLSSPASITAILVSVSRYDAINAAFGRAVGDAVLQAAARRIERHVGTDHLVARLAGAEFAIFLGPPASLEDGRWLATELVEAVGRPFASDDHVITLAARAGVAVSDSGDDATALLRRASLALAEARGAERTLVGVLGNGAESETAREERLAVDLRRALDRDEIEILFQPQVTIARGEIVGAEALARWLHPEFGQLSAGVLFGVAQRSDYLAVLSDHVQRRSLLEARDWPDSLARLRLSVNLVAADMLRSDFAARFAALVEESGFPADRLTVEVTESGLIEDLSNAAALLAKLRAFGLRVAVDDFGTGYSSLAYLKALPLDYLKLDRRLSQDIAGSARDRVVVRGVIEMARSLGLDVVAEGVETEEQLALLAREGCTYYQGFLCSPPIRAAELAVLAAGS